MKFHVLGSPCMGFINVILYHYETVTCSFIRLWIYVKLNYGFWCPWRTCTQTTDEHKAMSQSCKIFHYEIVSPNVLPTRSFCYGMWVFEMSLQVYACNTFCRAECPDNRLCQTLKTPFLVQQSNGPGIPTDVIFVLFQLVCSMRRRVDVALVVLDWSCCETLGLIWRLAASH